MCIAIYKPEGIKLFEHTLKNSWDNNDDGAGFMYAEKNKLHIKKGFFTFDEFMSAYEPHQEKKAVLHFRIKTHGLINTDNCHPFQVDNNLGFVHNGMISKVKETKPEFSDTWHFNEEIIKPIRARYPGFFKDGVYHQLIDNFIGASKLIFLNSKGEHSIINESAGVWDSQCWFSNTSYARTKYVPPKQVTYMDSYESHGYGGSKYGNMGKPEETLLPGNVCWMKYSYGGFKSGSYVVVKYHYNDRTVGVHERGNPLNEQRVPIWCLERTSISTLEETDFQIGDTVFLNNNYNHFRQYDEVVIRDELNNGAYMVEDPETKRFHAIPKSRLMSLQDYIGVL